MSEVITLQGERPPTLQEALAEWDVDLRCWEVERHIVNKWQMARKDKDVNLDYDSGAATGRVHDQGGVNKVWLYQIKVWLRRKSAGEVTTADLLEQLRRRSPKRPRYRYRGNKNAHHALEVSIPDVHLGLMTFAEESDAEYSFDTARDLYLGAVHTILARAKSFPVEKILFPLGNDLMHSADTSRPTTSKNTVLESAAHGHEQFRRARDLLIEAVDVMKRRAPVEVVVCPGNHSGNAEVHMGYVLQAYYHNDPNVTVHANNNPRHYWRYGVNLVGFEHGDSVRVNRLGLLMAAEAKEDWAETTHREFHLGHQHRKGVMEDLGVSIEWIPSLVPSDHWHKLHGYVLQKRGAVGFVWGRDEGLVARLHVNVF